MQALYELNLEGIVMKNSVSKFNEPAKKTKEMFDAFNSEDTYLKFSNDEEKSEFINQLYIKNAEFFSGQFTNEEFINWGRARSLIESENILVNHRITWMLISQAFIFTIFGVLFKYLAEGDYGKGEFVIWPLNVLIFLGAFVCILTYFNIKNAYEQINRVTDWWYSGGGVHSAWKSTIGHESAKRAVARKRRKLAAIDLLNKRHPPLHYSRSIEAMRETKLIRKAARFFLFLFRIESLPWYFFSAWVVILFIMNSIEKMQNALEFLSSDSVAPAVAYFTVGALVSGVIIAATLGFTSRD